jgi:hypothetical protein
MSTNVPKSFQVKFQNNVEMALQDQATPLLDAVTVQDDASAEKIKIKDIVGNTSPNEGDERHGDTRYNNPDYDGVWLAKPNELYYADLIDRDDQLATSIGLQGTSTMSGAGTIARARTQRILEGLRSSIVSGKTGTVTTPVPNGAYVAVDVGAAAATKMNTAKIRAATKYLLKGYVDPNLPKFMLLTAEDNDALLTEIPATSADFKASYKGEVDDNGMLRRLLGWNFIHEELDNSLLGTVSALYTDGSGYRLNPFWVKPGVVANFWNRLHTSVSVLPQKRDATQVYAGTTLAATRTQAGMSGFIRNLKDS